MDFSTELLGEVVALLKGEVQSWIASHPEARAMELESALREGMKQVGAACLEGVLETQNARYPQPEVACACGEQAPD